MSSEHKSLNFKWVGIRTVESGTQWNETQPMHVISFNPNFNDEPSSNRRLDSDRHPLFYLLDFCKDFRPDKKDYPEAISEAYGSHFRSRLKYLRNCEEFVEIFDYNYYKTNFYDDALEYIDELPYDSLYINEVSPTKSNIYYR